MTNLLVTIFPFLTVLAYLFTAVGSFYTNGTSLLVSNEGDGDLTLNVKHLQIILFHLPPSLVVIRNSTGHVVQINGPLSHILNWISRDLHFRFSYLNDNIKGMEDSPNSKGMISYLVEKKADLILGAIAMTPDRLSKILFPYPYFIGCFALMIPMPQPTANFVAISQPFQYQVWAYLSSTILLTTAALHFLDSRIFLTQKSSIRLDRKTKNHSFSAANAFQYVFRVLLSQGLDVQGYKTNKHAVRCLTGAWCLTAFFLVSAYSSVLISFITLPHYTPLLNSVYDLPSHSHVKITVDRGWAPDVLFLNAKSGFDKFLGDLLRKEPELRCNQTSDCIERVRQGSSAYVMSINNILNTIGENLKKSGRCEFTMAKETFWNMNVGLGLSRYHSDMLDDINRSMMKMHEAGLIDLWMRQSVIDPTRCLNPANKIPKKPRLTLIGLSGAFIVLVFGLFSSFLLFLLDNGYHAYKDLY